MTATPYTPFYPQAGAWMREQRRHWQLTQAELAEQIGLFEAAMIEEIERGRMALPVFVRDAVATVFAIDRADLAEFCAEWYGTATRKAA